MGTKVVAVVLLGALFIPAACAPASAAPSVFSPTPVLQKASPVYPSSSGSPVNAEQVHDTKIDIAPAILSPTLTPSLVAQGLIRVESLVLEPNVVELGTNVTVAVSITNTGGTATVYPLTIKIDGKIVKTQDVLLAPGETQDLNLIISAPIYDGVYHVSIDNFNRELDVWS